MPNLPKVKPIEYEKWVDDDLHEDDPRHSESELTDAMVVSPPHYNSGKFEVIDVIWDWKLDSCDGNIIKYVSRAKHKHSTKKGQLQDYEKALFYLKYKIARLKEELEELGL